MPSQRKIDIVQNLKDKVARAKSMVFTNYQGLTHKQLEQLKKAVKATDSEFITTKNTLIKLALATNNQQLTTNNLEGPTATLFVYGDLIAALRELAKTIRTLKLPTIKFAIIDGEMVDGEVVLRLATLPSREVLIAQVIGGLKTPLFRLHRALSWNMQKLVMTLSAIQQKKS